MSTWASQTNCERPHSALQMVPEYPLARAELQESLAVLTRRLPRLALAGSAEPRWKPSFVLRGLQELPVTS